MIKLLVTNGCSMTAGEELDSPRTQAWPVLLARALGVELVNMGLGGGSNRRIVRTTVATLPALCEQRSIAPEETLVVCTWTRPDRTEHFDPGFTRRRSEFDADVNWRVIGPFNDSRDKQAKAFYRHLWSEEGQIGSFLLEWILLDSFLRLRGYVSRYAFAYRDVTALPTTPSLRGLPGQIDRTTVFGEFPVGEGMAFDDMTLDLPRAPRNHPLTEGHHRFAGALADWLAADPEVGPALPALRRADGDVVADRDTSR
ncbi:DUF6071 family protein [Saccharothrix deserti]|uniref:DUF6071 family protein n=1 Tax=Saccharothrix deserti TaxID=2593674 RepID=UPI00131CF8CC|nr:DUF6071 family protein [Saccharothrix deserti]